MRKVDPKHDIPVTQLSPKAIKQRLFNIENRKVDSASAKRLSKVATRLARFNGDFDVIQEIDTLYAAADKYMEKNVYPNAVCRKGCGYCCRVPVDVTLIEAARISLYINQELPDTMFVVSDEQKKTRCPFLGDDMCCSIYKVRPFNCRVFASMDSWHPCRDDQSHAQHNNRSQSAFFTLFEVMDHFSAQAKTPLDSCGDIREYFGVNPMSVP